MNIINGEGIDNSTITEMVESSIDKLCRDFHDRPSLYFTENDLVCKFYNFLPQSLKNFSVIDKNEVMHKLVHMEYPTPFRCDMNKSSFRMVSDSERKITDGKEGGKFRRGHYDFVVLNPLVIPQFSYEEIRSQNYELFIKNVKNNISPSNPMISYAIEFLLHRGNMKSEESANSFLDKIMQDHNKLRASKVPDNNKLGCSGFVGKYKTVAFFTDSRQQRVLKKITENDPDIILQLSMEKSR